MTGRRKFFVEVSEHNERDQKGSISQQKLNEVHQTVSEKHQSMTKSNIRQQPRDTTTAG